MDETGFLAQYYGSPEPEPPSPLMRLLAEHGLPPRAADFETVYSPTTGQRYEVEPYREPLASSNFRQFDWAKNNPQIAAPLAKLLEYIGMLPMAGSRSGTMKGNAVAHEARFPLEQAISGTDSTTGIRAYMNTHTGSTPAPPNYETRFLPRERHWSGVTRPRIDNENPHVGGNLFPESGPGFNVRGGYGSLEAALEGPHGPAILARIREKTNEAIAQERRGAFEVVPSESAPRPASASWLDRLLGRQPERPDGLYIGDKRYDNVRDWLNAPEGMSPTAMRGRFEVIPGGKKD